MYSFDELLHVSFSLVDALESLQDVCLTCASGHCARTGTLLPDRAAGDAVHEDGKLKGARELALAIRCVMEPLVGDIVGIHLSDMTRSLYHMSTFALPEHFVFEMRFAA